MLDLYALLSPDMGGPLILSSCSYGVIGAVTGAIICVVLAMAVFRKL